MTVYALLVLRGHCKGEISQQRWQIVAGCSSARHLSSSWADSWTVISAFPDVRCDNAPASGQWTVCVKMACITSRRGK